MGHLQIWGLLQGLQKPSQLLGAQVLGFDIVYPGHLDGKGGDFARMLLGGKIH